MLMTDQDKIHYLANILKVAMADKSLSAREASAIDEIRKNIDAKKTILTQSQKAIENGSYSFIKVGSFADQVRNTEDMLYVALTDADLSEMESNLVNEFNDLVGIMREQYEKIHSDILSRCNSSPLEIACPFCSKPTSAQAKFCSSCGKAITPSDPGATQIEFDIPQMGYAIEFCESSAAGFPAALQVAKATERIQTIQRGKKTWYMAPFLKEKFIEMTSLASALSGIRNRKVYLDGKEIGWGEVFGFVWCASRRDSAYRPIEYCFGKDENRLNPWGCKQSKLDWTEWAQWFSYGEWRKSGFLKNKFVFVFDKDRIRHELATNLFRFRFCPYMHQRFIDAVLNHFPAEVQVIEGGDWKYNHLYETAPGSIKILEERDGFRDEYFADGVRPRGFRILMDILKKGVAQAGYKAVDPSVIVSI